MQFYRRALLEKLKWDSRGVFVCGVVAPGIFITMPVGLLSGNFAWQVILALVISGGVIAFGFDSLRRGARELRDRHETTT